MNRESICAGVSTRVFGSLKYGEVYEVRACLRVLRYPIIGWRTGGAEHLYMCLTSIDYFLHSLGWRHKFLYCFTVLRHERSRFVGVTSCPEVWSGFNEMWLALCSGTATTRSQSLNFNYSGLLGLQCRLHMKEGKMYAGSALSTLFAKCIW